MNDSPRYLTYAENLSTQGVYFDPLNFWYISYVFFVYLSQLIDPSHGMIIFNQYLLGMGAMLALFFAAKRLTGRINTAFLIGLVFIVFPDNLNWHSYVLTESFYCSVLCFVFYFLVRLSQERDKLWLYLASGSVLLICFFSKPTSPALFIALAFPLVWKWTMKPTLRAVKISLVLLAGVFILFLANKMISSHRVMLIYEKGDIIFAMHQLPTHPHHNWMTVEVPEDLKKPSDDQPLLQQMGSFVLANPLFFTKLIFGKTVMYIAHIRPFWSWAHNISMAAFLWPLYYFSYQAIKKRLVTNYLSTVFVAYFVLHTLIISITWVDWDGRFFVPVIPMVIVFGVIGVLDYSEMTTRRT